MRKQSKKKLDVTNTPAATRILLAQHFALTTPKQALRMMDSLSEKDIRVIFDSISSAPEHNRRMYGPIGKWAFKSRGFLQKKVLFYLNLMQKIVSQDHNLRLGGSLLDYEIFKCFRDSGLGRNLDEDIAKGFSKLASRARGDVSFGVSMNDWREAVSAWGQKNMNCLCGALSYLPERVTNEEWDVNKGLNQDQRTRYRYGFWKYGSTSKEDPSYNEKDPLWILAAVQGDVVFSLPFETVLTSTNYSLKEKEDAIVLLSSKGFKPSNLAMSLASSIVSDETWSFMLDQQAKIYADKEEIKKYGREDFLNTALFFAKINGSFGEERCLHRMGSFCNMSKDQIKSHVSDQNSYIPMIFLAALIGDESLFDEASKTWKEEKNKNILISFTNAGLNTKVGHLDFFKSEGIKSSSSRSSFFSDSHRVKGQTREDNKNERVVKIDLVTAAAISGNEGVIKKAMQLTNQDDALLISLSKSSNEKLAQQMSTALKILESKKMKSKF